MLTHSFKFLVQTTHKVNPGLATLIPNLISFGPHLTFKFD